MLDANPLMIDIDVEQWANLHAAFLRPVRQKRRIIVIHEGGKVLKMSHSHGAEVSQPICRITDPERDVEQIYKANKDNVDLVLLLDRASVERYYYEVQESWDPDEDLDEYVARMYALLDKYSPGIQTFPGPASRQLGLQWTLPIGYSTAKQLIERFVPESAVAVLAIFSEPSKLWASLVLGFDELKKIVLISTVEQGIVEQDWKHEYTQILASVEQKFWHCGLGIFASKASVDKVLCSAVPGYTFLKLCVQGEIIVEPCTKSLAQSIKRFELHPLS